MPKYHVKHAVRRREIQRKKRTVPTEQAADLVRGFVASQLRQVEDAFNSTQHDGHAGASAGVAGWSFADNDGNC